MAADDPCFRLEVPLVVHGHPQRVTASPQPPGARQGMLFSLGGRSAGVAPCSDGSPSARDPASTTALLWQVENSSGSSILELGLLLGAEQQQQPHSSSLQLAFDVQLFPSVAVLRSSDDPTGTVTVVGLLASGVLFLQQLKLQSPQHAACSLACAAPTQYHDLSAQLSSHGSPTALTAASGTILVGCSDGVVLGLSHAAMRDGTAAFELQPGGWGINRLITGVFYRPQQAAVAALLTMQRPGAASVTAADQEDRTVLLAVYDDGSMRGFNIPRQQLLFSEALVLPQALQESGGGGARRPTLTFATLCNAPASAAAGSRRHEHYLVASFESSSATAARHHCLYTLLLSGAGRLAIQDRQELLSLGPAASVLSAAADAETLWVLVREHGSTHVHGLSFAGQPCKTSLLQEQLRALVVADNAADDAVALELWEDVLSRHSGSGFGAEEQVLGHVLGPSSLCRFSLRDTLANLGAQLTMGELEACGVQELRAYVAGAVQTLQRRSPSMTHCQSWVLFLRSYREAWSRRHAALSLYTHPASHQLLCVRGGGLLTLLRSCIDAEALWYSGGGGGGSDASSSAPGARQTPAAGSGGSGQATPQPQLLRNPELKAVHSSLKAVAACLGSLSTDAFVSLLASGLSTAKALGDTFTSLWLDGPAGAAGRPRDDVTRGQQSAWRQQRRALLLQLGQTLGAVHDPVGALQRYCDHLGLDQAVRGAAAGPGPGEVPVAALVAAAQQQAYARCSSLRDCLLLLTAMRRLAAAGTVPLDAAALGRAEAVLAPRLEHQLQGAALALWLASTPAMAAGDALDAGGSVEPALNALEHLTLGAGAGAVAQVGPLTLVPPGRAPPQHLGLHSQAQAQHAGGARADVALAARLLPSALPSIGPTGIADVGAAAARLVAWLQGYGGPRSGAGAQAAEPAPGWALELGFALLLRQEASALLPLSRLAAASHTQDGSAELLRGLSLVRQLPRAGSDAAVVAGPDATGAAAAAATQRTALVDEAAECFFRAASSFASGSRAGLPGIVRALRQIVTGSSIDTSAASGPPSQRLQLMGSSAPAPAHSSAQQEALLQFFEVAMMLFERECAPEGALTLARAALQQLSLLTAQTPAAAQPASWRPLQGRLWSNVFAYCCELGSYEEAYAAVVANPMPDRALDCLRRLVHELCERGRLRVLCSLPFAGALTLPAAASSSSSTAAASAAAASVGAAGALQPRLSGAPQGVAVGGGGLVVPLVAEVVAALQRRASNSDLLVRPQPYRVLHDFLVARSDFRGAARAMLALARRLRAEGPAGAAGDALAAYEAAINALSLVKEADAWLDLSDPWLRLHASPSKPPALLFGTDAPAAERGGGGGAGGWEDALLTLPQLRREYLLLRSAVAVAQKLPGIDPLQAWGGEDEVFAQLLLAGETDAALTLAHACFSGAALTAALERALGSLAAQAARLQMREEAELASSTHDALPGLSQPEQRERLLGQAQLGSRAAPHWVLLRQLLQRYDGARNADGVSVHGGCLRVAVADAVLRVDRRLALPPWLLQLFEEDPSVSGSPQGTPGVGPDFALLGVYLTHDRLSDAVAMVEGRVEVWSRTDPRQRRQLAVVWMPHQRIARLRARLAAEAGRGSEQAAGLLQRLDAAMQAHVELAAHDSDVDAAVLDAGGASTPASGGWPGFGTPGSADQDMGFGRHSLDALAPPPPALLWLPPPIDSIGS